MSADSDPDSLYATALALSEHPMFSQFSLLSQSQQMDDRKSYIYFIVPPVEKKEQCFTLNLENMYQAANARSLNVEWLTDEECTVKKLHDGEKIFVFDPFGSPGFLHWMQKLSNGEDGSPRVEIFGPKVLQKVFDAPQDVFQTEEIPVYNLAMKGMVITLLGIKDKQMKAELETLVRWMNGTFSSKLTRDVSHVVTVGALTPKCTTAKKQGIPVMLPNWIKQLWVDNQSTDMTSASDPRYNKFKCPIFYKVNICMSQLTQVYETMLKAAVENHGGKVSSEFVKKVTDVLVIQNPTGDKFKFAQEWKVLCVTPQWITMSLEKGYLLSPDDYKLTSSVANTPVSPNIPGPADSEMKPDGWNMTRCSAIMEVDDTNRVVVEESKINFTRTFSEMHEDAVSKLKTSAENLYLDGCKIYVVEYPKFDELKQALNESGAVRVDKLCEGVTHVIVNPDGQNLSKSIQEQIQALETTPHVVTIGWALQSAKDGNPADEELFKYHQPGLLVGLTFKVVNSDEAESKYLEEIIVKNGGTLVSDNPTVAILEPICDSIEKDRAEKAYTKHWLNDCLEVDSLDINHSFHHTPLCSFRKMEEILAGVVVAISQFGAIEREYLVEVVKALGGRYQDAFERKDSNDRKNAKSTHLICKTTNYNKAYAAKKWNVPIVRAEWVTERCTHPNLSHQRLSPPNQIHPTTNFEHLLHFLERSQLLKNLNKGKKRTLKNDQVD